VDLTSFDHGTKGKLRLLPRVHKLRRRGGSAELRRLGHHRTPRHTPARWVESVVNAGPELRQLIDEKLPTFGVFAKPHATLASSSSH